MRFSCNGIAGSFLVQKKITFIFFFLFFMHPISSPVHVQPPKKGASRRCYDAVTPAMYSTLRLC